jgi:ribosomal-protein-alanine N-acetyltransferase
MTVATLRLELREADIDYAADLKAYQNDSRYLEHYAEAPNTLALISLFKEWANSSPRLNYQFIIVLRESGTAIGCAGLRMEGKPDGEAELGVEINPDYWRQGFAREVVAALLEFGSSDLRVIRYVANTASTNRSAQQLLEEFDFACVYAQDNDLIYARNDNAF